MRKFTALLLALMMLCLPVLAEEDEDDLSMEDILERADPDAVSSTVVQPTDDSEATSEEEEEDSIYESDGSVLITITATGDFTIGGDSR